MNLKMIVWLMSTSFGTFACILLAIKLWVFYRINISEANALYWMFVRYVPFTPFVIIGSFFAIYMVSKDKKKSIKKRMYLSSLLMVAPALLGLLLIVGALGVHYLQYGHF